MAIGTFVTAGSQTIPVGTDIVRTSGYSTVGLGEALYCYDSAVNSAYVTANPRSSFLDVNNRGFRLAEQEIYATMFGAIGDGVANDGAAIKSALDYCIARKITLHFPTGTYSIPNWGTYTPSGDLDISGSGSEYAILDGGDKANHVRFALAAGTSNVTVRGLTFKSFDRPLTAYGNTTVISNLTLIDVNVVDSCNGVRTLCWIDNAYISRYRASNITGLVAGEDTYGLALGCDILTEDYALSYFIEDVHISHVDGTIHDIEVPTNAIAIRGHRMVLNDFRLENVFSNTESHDCEGFYAKVKYSEISNGYLYNAGHDEASFIIKNMGEGGILSHDNVVRNVHVRCDNGAVYRGFLWECGSVFAENCIAEGVEYSGFAAAPTLAPGTPILVKGRYTFNNCWVINSNAASAFILSGGNVELVDCGLASPTTGANKVRGLSFVTVPTYATNDVTLKLVGCTMQVPSTYDGTGDTNAIMLSNPAGYAVNRVQIDDFVIDDQSTTPANKRGVLVSGAGAVKEFFIDKPLFKGIPDVQAVRLLGKESALSITNWGEKTHFAISDNNTVVTESYVGRILNSSACSAVRVCTLPAARPGIRIGFLGQGTFGLTVQPASPDTIIGSSSVSVPVGTYAILECVASGLWAVK
ncbi:hypothetical protein [Singulisphaera sp. PoT]|uniref:hypothetical protein n=1 Tax=Singulisphaera sp. PoT TaxID=3411797 RepID=UPI003BF517A0